MEEHIDYCNQNQTTYQNDIDMINLINSKEAVNSIDQLVENIYSYPECHVNKLLINLQRNDDFGYISPRAYELDKLNLQDEIEDKHEYYTYFGNHMSCLRVYDKNSNMYLKPPEFFQSIYSLFKEILIKFNKDDYDILYVKANIGLTIVLANCVIRFMSLNLYSKLENLYNILSKPRTLELEDYDCFERIYQIYNFIQYNFVCIVSEKLTSVKTFDGLCVRPIFSECLDLIYDSISNARELLHFNGFLHNDLSLDNTGFRDSTGQFVVFDFEMASFNPLRCSVSNDKIRGLEK
jgi:hypothetical protein